VSWEIQKIQSHSKAITKNVWWDEKFSFMKNFEKILQWCVNTLCVRFCFDSSSTHRWTLNTLACAVYPNTFTILFFSFPSSYCVVCNLWVVLSRSKEKNIENLGISYFVIMILLQRQNQQNKKFPLSKLRQITKATTESGEISGVKSASAQIHWDWNQNNKSHTRSLELFKF
jgi:hypothetical protein